MASGETREGLKPGDVLELATARGLAYVQLLGKHPAYGDMVKVLPRVFETRPVDFSAIDQVGYAAFYPARAAVSRGVLQAVGWLQIVEDTIPRRLRRRSRVDAQGRVHGWFIMAADGTETFREQVGDEEIHLPIASIWNHEHLRARIEEGWRPEMEGGRAEASGAEPVAVSADVSDTPGARPVTHHLYFSKKKVALAAVREIWQRGYCVEPGRSTPGGCWLLRVKQSADPAGDEINAARALLEGLAARLHGEYDGHQVQVE